MGMSFPPVAGQTSDSADLCSPSLRAQSLSRHVGSAETYNSPPTGLDFRVARKMLGGAPTWIKRKRLPWLDGGQQSKPGTVPGGFAFVDNPEPASYKERDAAASRADKDIVNSPPDPELAADQSIIPPSPDQGPPTPLNRPPITSPDPDPAVRAIGSEPEMRTMRKASDHRKLSLSPEPRPGIKPTTSRQQAKRALGVVDEIHRDEAYSPSEYSATLASDREPMPSYLPKRDPASYERLVDHTARRKRTSNQPVHITDRWLQSQLELPITDTDLGLQQRARRSPSSCESCKRHESMAGLPAAKARQKTRRATDPSQDIQRPPSAYSPPSRQVTAAYDEVRARRGLESERQPSNADRSQSGFAQPQQIAPRRTTSMPLHAQPPPPRASTLPGLPSHLMASSSSSGPDVPSHLQTSASSTSPEKSPQPALRRPAPTEDRQTLNHQSRSLNRAVTGLENLVEEALNVAKDAAQSGRSADVAHILDHATMALRKASTVQRKMAEPLVLSPHESGASSDSERDSMSDTSPKHSREGSAETAPTLLTRSAQSSRQPIVMPRYKKDGRTPTSEKAAPHSSGEDSIAKTPPRLYQPHSADSIVRDFAYPKKRASRARAAKSLTALESYGAAAEFYGDHGESTGAQPGVRRSVAPENVGDKPLPNTPALPHKAYGDPNRRRFTRTDLQELEHVPTDILPAVARGLDTQPHPKPMNSPSKGGHHHPHVSEFFESYYYRHSNQNDNDALRKASTVTDTRPRDADDSQRPDSKRARKHISLKEGQGFSLGRYHRRQPIAREWSTSRKRITATIACFNTVFIGLIAGIYAGEVPKIQYQIADLTHQVILGNVLLFVGLGVTTLIFWPLPLLHGRKPYTLLAFAIMLPLQFPQALAVSGYRDPSSPIYRIGLLAPRILTGLAMGFANINQLPTLFDLFGVSLMSERPHQEVVVYDDVRRQGGGVGIWLGIWSWCFVGSLSIGFCCGACIISSLDPSWGFYIVVILLAVFLLINVIAPETRRAPYRRSIAHFFDEDEKLHRRVARGEVKLHISNDGPKWWFQEVWAGIILTKRMLCQPGYFILMVYIAWVYAEVTLVILLLGALLSRNYQWQPQYIGGAVSSLAIGALFATPLAKASLFSRARFTPPRTDSMTMREPRVTWTSHLLRRCIFTLLLPFATLAYTLSSPGPSVGWASPVIFCGLVGFLSNLAIAECVGLIMENFDTCDLQPGVNQKHRLQSMTETTRRRRTNYSSFPRVCAGFFCAQALGFFLSAAATGVSGDVTRALGAQEATAIVAGVLLVVTVALLIALWRGKEVQVIPNNALSGTKSGSIAWGPGATDPEWKPVIIGNPSGKMRRVNVLETGSLSRWTEIRKLNKLIKN